MFDSWQHLVIALFLAWTGISVVRWGFRNPHGTESPIPWTPIGVWLVILGLLHSLPAFEEVFILELMGNVEGWVDGAIWCLMGGLALGVGRWLTRSSERTG